MTAKPTVSVLMPVRNGMPYIDEAIRSICAQTWSDWEMIVVDDGSSDGTLALLEKWAQSDARIRIIALAPSGLVAAANATVAAAQGRYLARLDSDDVAHPYRLALQVACMERRPELVAVGSAIRLFGSRSGLLFTPLTNWGCRGRLLFENCFAHSSVMIRRSMVEHLLPLYEAQAEYAEDLALWVRISPLGAFANLPRPLVKYRVHQRQISREKVKVLQRQHASLAVMQWHRFGVDVSPEDFERFRWPNFGVSGSWGVVKHSLVMMTALSPMFLTRYAPQAAWWLVMVGLRNVVKVILPPARRFL